VPLSTANSTRGGERIPAADAWADLLHHRARAYADVKVGEDQHAKHVASLLQRMETIERTFTKKDGTTVTSDDIYGDDTPVFCDITARTKVGRVLYNNVVLTPTACIREDASFD
jgi:hypothetical protein